MEHPFSVTSHVFLIIVSLAAFSVSFVLAVIFLLQHHFLETKHLGPLFFRLPPLELTAKLNFLFLTIGIVSMLAGVFLGLFLRRAEQGMPVLREPMTWLSFIMLGLYAAILFVRQGPVERSRGVAYVAIVSYAFLLFTFAAAHAGMR